MRYRLIAHPDTPPSTDMEIDTRVQRLPGGSLAVVFCLSGKLADLTIPAETGPRRRDGLWHHSCFEAFVAGEGPLDYYEFNLSPSREWAAYRFSAYRAGMSDAGLDPPYVDVMREPERLELRATLALPADLRALPLRLGLSAVIEARDGTKSYWAVAHPPGKPDFHHRDCFAAQVAAADQA